MRELEQRSRGGVVQGVVLGVDDDGEVQTCTVETHDGVVRSGIPVMSIHGFASNPSDGGIAVLLAIEGDQSNMVALPIALPGARLGGLPPGGASLYDDAGNRMMLNGDGTGTLTTAALMTFLVQSLLVQAQDGTVFRGPVTFQDGVTFVADVAFAKNVTIGGNLRVIGSLTHG